MPLTKQLLCRDMHVSKLASAPRDLQRWVERELQAVMMQGDVALITSHVLGTYQYCQHLAASRQVQPTRCPNKLCR